MIHPSDTRPVSESTVAGPPPLAGRRRLVVDMLDRATRELVPMPHRHVDRYLRRLAVVLRDLAAGAENRHERKVLDVAALRVRMFLVHWPARPAPDTAAELCWTRDLMAMVTIDLPRIRDALATFDRSRLTPLRMNPPRRSRPATAGTANRRIQRASR